MIRPAVDALVPAKDFARAKERLGPLLSPEERTGLARAMFVDVVEALREAPGIRRVWVVSGSAEVLDLASASGCTALAETPDLHGLNAALEYGRRTVCAVDAPAALLVLPADVPGATASAVARIIDDAGAAPLVRICPAADHGTNALLLCPPNAVPFRYGRNSAERHAEEAQHRNISCETVTLNELAIDLDTPNDVRSWLATRPQGRAAELLRRLAPGWPEATVRPGRPARSG